MTLQEKQRQQQQGRREDTQLIVCIPKLTCTASAKQLDHGSALKDELRASGCH
jgi:hypothetical protein